MAIPADVQWEQAPYGARPAYLVGGNQGGPYALMYPDLRFAFASVAVSGTTTVITPTLGKRFRLLYYRISLLYGSATVGSSSVAIRWTDGGVLTGIAVATFIPATAQTAGGPPLYDSGWCYLGTGYLSSAVNNALGINPGVSLSAGFVSVSCAIAEE